MEDIEILPHPADDWKDTEHSTPNLLENFKTQPKLSDLIHIRCSFSVK